MPGQRLDYAAALELLQGARSVAVCGHVNPDGDALGSVLGMTLALRKMGYDAKPLLATRDCPETYDFLEGFASLVPACEYHASPDVFVSVDVPSIQRTGDGAHVFARASRSIALDHHQGPADFADVNLVDADAAAAGMLVWDFAQAAGVADAAIATCCYTALLTDTGGFQFQNADFRALSAAATMVDAGADPAAIAGAVYQRASVAKLRLHALVTDRMQSICDGHAVLSYVTEDDFAALGATLEDGESLIDTIRQLGGIDVAVMLRGQGPVVRGSIRSKAGRDVAAIARKMNGGGHAAAAGFTIKGTLDQARATVTELLEESFAAQAAQLDGCKGLDA